MTSTFWQLPIWSETLNEAPEPKAVDAEAVERETMEFDVVIVGAGPAGLAAAIRLKQLAAETGKELSVVVLEKGSEVGAHILSGAVIDPVGLDALIPDWRDKGSPLTTEVSEDKFYYLWKTGGIRVPNLFMPPLMSNHGCYIGSLGALTRWLAEQAEAPRRRDLSGLLRRRCDLRRQSGEIEGVITGDMGVARDGSHKDNYTPGIAILGKYTLFAEGARGSLSKMLIRKLGLDAEFGPAEIRHRPQGAVGGAGREAQARPRPAHHGLAARRQDRRRLLPLSFRRAAGVGGLRRPSRLREPLPQPVQGISARQDASADRRASRPAASASPMARAL